jgi:hypothetical protein
MAIAIENRNFQKLQIVSKSRNCAILIEIRHIKKDTAKSVAMRARRRQRE